MLEAISAPLPVSAPPQPSAPPSAVGEGEGESEGEGEGAGAGAGAKVLAQPCSPDAVSAPVSVDSNWAAQNEWLEAHFKLSGAMLGSDRSPKVQKAHKAKGSKGKASKDKKREPREKKELAL